MGAETVYETACDASLGKFVRERVTPGTQLLPSCDLSPTEIAECQSRGNFFQVFGGSIDGVISRHDGWTVPEVRSAWGVVPRIGLEDGENGACVIRRAPDKA